jgi:murein L,D-transpeptidase YcbB/YkuD
VDWRSLNGDNFPYYLVQDPGPLNPLGRVKFFLPNDRDIFMHDTPSRDLFKHKSRAFSSGCIRVGKAIEVAEYLLKQEGGSSFQSMAEALKSGKTTEIELSVPFPLRIIYLTAWADEKGHVQFRDDIYALDALTDAREVRQRQVHREVARAYETEAGGCAALP